MGQWFDIYFIKNSDRNIYSAIFVFMTFLNQNVAVKKMKTIVRLYIQENYI